MSLGIFEFPLPLKGTLSSEPEPKVLEVGSLGIPPLPSGDLFPESSVGDLFPESSTGGFGVFALGTVSPGTLRDWEYPQIF